ncbi:MAG: glycosyltransferase [Phycisphaeraceae bacterium]
MITYNHQRYVAQAIDSVLMQRTNFDWELVIGEDCSPDGTGALVADYQRREPQRIRVLPRLRNLGASHNFVDTYFACGGQYVALLEGDDYWTDPNKLQAQVEALDAHPEWSMCGHRVHLRREDGQPVQDFPPPWACQRVLTLGDLLASNLLPACSVVFRHRLIEEFPSWHHQLAMGDWSVHILNAHHGLIGMLPVTMAVYRLHDDSMWAGRDELWRAQQCLRAQEQYSRIVDRRWSRRARLCIADSHGDLARLYRDRGDLRKARACAWRYLLGGGWQVRSHRGQRLLTALRLAARLPVRDKATTSRI